MAFEAGPSSGFDEVGFLEEEFVSDTRPPLVEELVALVDVLFELSVVLAILFKPGIELFVGIAVAVLFKLGLPLISGHKLAGVKDVHSVTEGMKGLYGI